MKRKFYASLRFQLWIFFVSVGIYASVKKCTNAGYVLHVYDCQLSTGQS